MHTQRQANAQHDSSHRDSSHQEAESDAPAAASASDTSAIDAAQLEALLDRFMSGDFDIAAAAKQMGISIFALAQWVNVARNAELLEGLLRLQDFAAHSFLGHMTRPAIAQLVHLSREESKPDIARKACVDLLKATPGSTRALNAARVLALAEKVRVAGEKSVREDGTTKRSNSEVVKTSGPTGFAFRRPVVSVSEDNIRRMFEQMANGERPTDPRPTSPSRPPSGSGPARSSSPVRPAYDSAPAPARSAQPPHASPPSQSPSSSKPCVITLRREPLMPRQDLGATSRVDDARTTSARTTGASSCLTKQRDDSTPTRTREPP